MLGVAHPSGYPLFTMLGHAFTLLPLGTPAYRVNLMSAVFDAITVALVVLCTYQLLAPQGEERRGENRKRQSIVALAGAAFAGLILSFSASFWAYSVVAEVFALNNLFAALILTLLLAWERRPERLRLIWASGFASGLAATNHQTIVLLAPACLLLLFSGSRSLLTRTGAHRFTWKRLVIHFAIAGAFFILGLLPYLYLPFAARTDPALNWGNPQSLESFARDITRADYGSLRLTVAHGTAPTPPSAHIGLLLRSLWGGFTPISCSLAAFGSVWLWRRRRVALFALLLAFVFTGPVFLAYAAPPIDSQILYGVLERFYILPGLFLAIASGAGICMLGDLVEWLPMRQGIRFAPVAAVLFAAPFGSASVHYAAADHSSNQIASNFGQDLLTPLDQGALLIVQGDAPTMAVDYLQQVQSYRRDIVPLNMEKLKMPSYVDQVHRQHPEVAIPFQAYRPGGNQLAQLVDANLPSRSVYIFGNAQDSNFGDQFESEYAGFATRLLAKGSGSGSFALMSQRLDLYERARFPTRTYPDTTFESGIVRSYGSLAFNIGFLLDDGTHVQQAIDFYRLSIRLSTPEASAYKNLGLLLFNQGEPAGDVGPLWEEYLRLKPDDPQAGAIRERLRQMGAAG
jgi:hypothetical protein